MFVKDVMHDEIRAGFLVTTDRKKIWEKELEIVQVFSDLCARHHWRWWAAYGTLLGAARHQGFIPWDDDVDVYMPRPDYQAFQRVAAEELPAPFVFRNSYCNNRILAFSKIHNSETMAIEFADFPQLEQGLFLDIFPLDAMPDDDAPEKQVPLNVERELWILTVQRDNLLQAIRRGYVPTMPMEELRTVAALPVRKRFEIFEDVATAAWGSTQTLGDLIFDKAMERRRFPASVLEETVQLPFEECQLPAFAAYDLVLQHCYGDWHVFERGTSSHTFSQMSADISWREYFRSIAQAPSL